MKNQLFLKKIKINSAFNNIYKKIHNKKTFINNHTYNQLNLKT